MSRPNINPFAPDSPVSPGLFAGRAAELRRLRTVLSQTVSGHPTYFLVTGERGLGKSSLLRYFEYAAKGKDRAAGGSAPFLVIACKIDPLTTRLGLAKMIRAGLEKALAETELFRDFLRSSWAFADRLEAVGIQHKPSGLVQSEQLLLEEFVRAFAEIVNRLCSGGSSDVRSAPAGIVLLIDDLDRASADLALGSFFGLLTEHFSRSGCSRVALGFAGLPGIHNEIARKRAVSVRVCEELALRRFSDDDVHQLVNRSLQFSNDSSAGRTAITAEAKNRLAFLSGGFPHFLQRIAHSAFAADGDGLIEVEDIERGAFGPRGAVEQIGEFYSRDASFSRIRKESHRQVLRIMASNLDGWTTRSQMRSEFGGREFKLDNALLVLRSSGIIAPSEQERGAYRLLQQGFAWWTRLSSEEPGSLGRDVLVPSAG